MKKKKSQKKGLSVQQYAAHRKAEGLPGGHRNAVYKALRSGRIAKNKAGLIDPEKADSAWRRNTTPREKGDPEKRKRSRQVEDQVESQESTSRPDALDQMALGLEDPESKAAASTSKSIWQAKNAKLDFELKAGKLVDREEIEQALFRLFRSLRDRMMNISPRMSAHLDEEGQRQLELEIRNALEQLSREVASSLSP